MIGQGCLLWICTEEHESAAVRDQDAASGGVHVRSLMLEGLGGGDRQGHDAGRLGMRGRFDESQGTQSHAFRAAQ